MSNSALLSLNFNKLIKRDLYFKIGVSFISRFEFYYDYKIDINYYINGSVMPTFIESQQYTNNSYKLSRTNFVYFDLGVAYKFGKE